MGQTKGRRGPKELRKKERKKTNEQLSPLPPFSKEGEKKGGFVEIGSLMLSVGRVMRDIKHGVRLLGFRFSLCRRIYGGPMVSRERKRTRDRSVCTTAARCCLASPSLLPSLFEKSSREFTLCSFYRSSYMDNGHVQSKRAENFFETFPENETTFFFFRKRVKGQAKSIERRIFHFS